jgi:hypothetical protein
MTEENLKEITKDFQVRIPAKLAKRVRTFASENDNTITGVVIEALDIFLRKKNKQNNK